jgi:hypothetical protein
LWQHCVPRLLREYSYHEKFGTDRLDDPRSGATKKRRARTGRLWRHNIARQVVLSGYERGPASQPSPEDPIAQIASIPSIPIAADGKSVQPFSDVVDVPPKADILFNLPISIQATPSSSANGWVEAQMPELLKAMSDLHKAVVEPDISTAKGDRERAIGLRWELRDIKCNRLKWSPVNPQDLRILIIMGLVEMRDGVPVLTNAGVSAIM